MSTPWKDSIKKYLSSQNEKHLRNELKAQWLDIFPEDKNEIYEFLFHSQQHKVFLYLFAIDFQSDMLELPWHKALEIVRLRKIKTSQPLIDELSRALHKLGFTNEKNQSLDEIIESLAKREKYAFMQKMLTRKQELIESARIAKSERLMDQYIHYMNELKRMAPSEYNLAQLNSKQDRDKARRIIESRNKDREHIEVREKDRLSELEFALAEKIGEQAQSFLKDQKAEPGDFAYLLRSMGLDQWAIEFIQQENNPETKDWQLLEYLLHGKQHISLLEHCRQLKSKHSGRPEALFSISYAEAIAYWELGEKNRAIDLMTQIASMRPDFKSATETLAQWKEDSFE